MRLRTIGVLAAVISTFATGSILAGTEGTTTGGLTPTQRAAIVRQLETEQHQVSRRMLTPPYNKGPLQASYMDRYSQLSGLIDRLQNGEAVSPDEIDRAVQPTSH